MGKMEDEDSDDRSVSEAAEITESSGEGDSLKSSLLQGRFRTGLVADAKLLLRAIERGWPISYAAKREIVSRVLQALRATDSPDAISKLASVAVSADRLNVAMLKEIVAASRTSISSGGGPVQINVGERPADQALPKESTTPVDDLEARLAGLSLGMGPPASEEDRQGASAPPLGPACPRPGDHPSNPTETPPDGNAGG